jgi:hypothetical protein
VGIVRRSGGYTLVVDQADQAVDLLRFRGLRDRARGTDDDTRKVALLTEALALWRGAVDRLERGLGGRRA